MWNANNEQVADLDNITYENSTSVPTVHSGLAPESANVDDVDNSSAKPDVGDRIEVYWPDDSE